MDRILEMNEAAKKTVDSDRDRFGNGRYRVEAEQPDGIIEKFRNEVAEGMLYAHSRVNSNTSKILEVASFSYALIELLMERELLSIEELDERKRIVGERLLKKFVEKGMGVALTQGEQDKYDFRSEADIDCPNRLHLCRAACCRLRFALSVQDVEEGRVRWELGRPYMIRMASDGYCHHLERETCCCNIYEQRPIICRSYDCRKDNRIWADFEEKIISPDLGTLFKTHSGNGGAADAAKVEPFPGEEALRD